MKILVTGAKGFIGKNLICELKNRKYEDIYSYDIDTSEEKLEEYCQDCDFIFHLAGVNRPKEEKEFMQGNFGFTSKLLETLKKHQNKCPIMISSSIQAELDNPYGKSKKAGEELLFDYSKETGAKVYVYRFPNVYGKWCRPNYNSAIATFCYNISRDIPIIVNNRETKMKLVYIDDVFNELISLLEGKGNQEGNYYKVAIEDETTLGEIVDLLHSFKENRKTLKVPNMNRHLEKCLYSTYLSYLPENQYKYELFMHEDYRGSFTELLHFDGQGQLSVNIFKPGITKGNHYHHTKVEKFIVVKGQGCIRFRKIDSDEIFEYFVSDKKLEVVDVPVGYTHSFVNHSNEDMVAIIWCNEIYNPEKPDTYYLEVEECKN